MSEAHMDKHDETINGTAPQAEETAMQAPSDTPATMPEAAIEATDTTGETESFADLFAAQEQETSSASRLAPGQRVKAAVVAVTSDTVFVSTGSKVDGIVDLVDLNKNDPTPVVGDILDLYVVTVSPHEVRLSKTVSGAGGLQALEDARDAGLPVDGKVQALVKGGFAVEIMKRRAFCPQGQIDIRPSDTPEAFVGQTLPFLITKLEKNGRNIVVSRRVLLEREHGESRSAFMATITEGDVLEGSIVRLAPFGAFVELAPGVEGLIHLSELSWARVGSADEVASVGDSIRVKIVAIAETEKGPRISLSARQVMDDPWKSIGDRIHEGEVVSGKVVRNAAFGAFVEVLPGIEGLIHVSELSYERNVRKPDEIVTVGETVTVKVKNIDLEKKRLSLSLREVGSDPWDSVAEQFPVGQEVTGTLEKKAPFGMFITLSPGVTGLLPASTIAASRGKSRFDKMQPGESIPVLVRELDITGRKVTLGLADVTESGHTGGSRGPSAEERDWKKHAPKTSPLSFGGTLGAALQAAKKKK